MLENRPHKRDNPSPTMILVDDLMRVKDKSILMIGNRLAQFLSFRLKPFWTDDIKC